MQNVSILLQGRSEKAAATRSITSETIVLSSKSQRSLEEYRILGIGDDGPVAKIASTVGGSRLSPDLRRNESTVPSDKEFEGNVPV